MMRLVLISLFAIFLNACESNPPAPVVDRKPQTSKAKPASTKSNTAIKTADGKDWRPDTYIVKKGDTLFSIGLENGFEYKEIAAANRINEPYTIHIGQKLNLATLTTAALLNATKLYVSRNAFGSLNTGGAIGNVGFV